MHASVDRIVGVAHQARLAVKPPQLQAQPPAQPRQVVHLQWKAALPDLVGRTLQIAIAEVITLTVFVPFALLYLKEPLKLDYLWAALCLMGAVYFVFRSRF